MCNQTKVVTNVSSQNNDFTIRQPRQTTEQKQVPMPAPLPMPESLPTIKVLHNRPHDGPRTNTIFDQEPENFPSPSEYSPREMEVAIRHSISQKSIEVMKPTPAPGQYEAIRLERIRRRAPKFSMATSTQGYIYKEIAWANKLGPSDYNVNLENERPTPICIGKRRTEQKPETVPPPNQSNTIENFNMQNKNREKFKIRSTQRYDFGTKAATKTSPFTYNNDPCSLKQNGCGKFNKDKQRFGQQKVEGADKMYEIERCAKVNQVKKARFTMSGRWASGSTF